MILIKAMKLIGIDPDIDKNGIAVSTNNEFRLYNLNFFDTIDLIDKEKADLVIIEGGWLNKGNWHTSKKGTAALNAKIGGYVGANQAVGKLLVQYCERNKIAYDLIKPVRSKLDHSKFNLYVECKRSNQEVRDAAMLIVRHHLYNRKKGIKIN